MHMREDVIEARSGCGNGGVLCGIMLFARRGHWKNDAKEEMMPQHPALTAGRAAVITGGASGIGLAAAKRFAALGMKLCLADLRQDALDNAAAELAGATLITVPTDVSRMEEVRRLKERAYAEYG